MTAPAPAAPCGTCHGDGTVPVCPSRCDGSHVADTDERCFDCGGSGDALREEPGHETREALATAAFVVRRMLSVDYPLRPTQQERAALELLIAYTSEEDQ